ncbi:MAG: hypothetical protein SNJ72_06345 [Fimbriimonadales bacterium]
MERPASILVIGVLGIIFGLAGACCMLVGLGGAAFVSGMTDQVAQQSPEQAQQLEAFKDPEYMRYLYFNGGVSLVFAILLLVGSILLIGMKSLGYSLMTAWSILSILWNLLSIVLGMTVFAAVLERYNQSITQPTNLVGYAIGMVFPVIVLFILTRPGMKERFV